MGGYVVPQWVKVQALGKLVQFKKRTTYLDIPGTFHDFHQHVVKTCPLCNSKKPRPERSRVSGLQAEEFGDFIFLDQAWNSKD